MTILHFGAGALGRGLVMERITSSGANVAVADINPDIIDAVRADGGFSLTVAGPERSEEHFVPVVAAYAIGRDDSPLQKAISIARVVTTSVQIGNLPKVVARLGQVWDEMPGHPRTAIGAENMRHVGQHFGALFEKAGYGHLPIHCPDCLVDRICAGSLDGQHVTTEVYSEWAVEVANGPDFGADYVRDVDALFFRKRYLVNTLADGASMLGLGKGYTFLHEAVSDRSILDQLDPLLDALRRHLVRVYGFADDALKAYQDTSIVRLSNAALERRLETVARDPWRKFTEGERFLEPLIIEHAYGQPLDTALNAFASIIAAVEPDTAQRSSKLDDLWSKRARDLMTPHLGIAAHE